jgi:hypothetical protein
MESKKWIAVGAASVLSLGALAGGAVSVANAMPLIGNGSQQSVPGIYDSASDSDASAFLSKLRANGASIFVGSIFVQSGDTPASPASVQSPASPVSVQSPASPVSVQSPASPVSVQSAASPASVQSPASPVSVQSAASPVSVQSPASPASPASSASPASVPSATSVPSVD